MCEHSVYRLMSLLAKRITMLFFNTIIVRKAQVIRPTDIIITTSTLMGTYTPSVVL